MILYNAATFLRRIKRMILKRMVLFRVLFYGTVILTVSAILQAGKLSENESSITPSFFAEHTTLPGQRFKVSGVVKHGSISMKKGTLENKFIISDFKHDLVVLYKGALP